MSPVRLSAIIIAALSVALSPIYGPLPAPAVRSALAASVPVPANLSVQYEDDRAAVLTWDDEMRPDRSNPPGVDGSSFVSGTCTGTFTPDSSP